MNCNVVVAKTAERQIAEYDLAKAVRSALYDFLANQLPERDPKTLGIVYPHRRVVGCGFQVVDPNPPGDKHTFCFHLIPGDDGKTLVLVDTGHCVRKVLSGPHSKLLFSEQLKTFAP